MSLDSRQISELETAIASYAFPAVYRDFRTGVEVQAQNMRVVETAIRSMLVSTATGQVKAGLANVIYWGYAQIGYRDFRVQRFCDRVSEVHLHKFQALVGAKDATTLANIAAIGLPEFSGIAFISKVLAFLDPVR